jgi:DNA-binding winged helix-turn-helix (wHTH) protein/tetratricopeptide (TPR) repeat protein
MSLETQPAPVLRFGTFEVDVRVGELRKQGVRIKLQEQPFLVLKVLLARPGGIVSREQLRSQIWSADTFVDFDNSLNTSINKLREALGDSADSPRFVETIPRRGYRFIAPVTSAGSLAPPHGPAASVRRWKIMVAAASMAFILTGAALYWRSRQTHRLTEKDTIVLADFLNRTGDPIFDDALKQGLRVHLEQSPFINILSDEKASEALQRMGRSREERITWEVAHDLCQRLGSKAVLVGSISSLGTHYVIGLNALECLTGDALARQQVEADSREHVLRALGDAATAMRRELGESLSTIQKYGMPMEQVTTSSLEALQAYSLGQKAWRINGGSSSLPFFKRAADLDPDFAMAYAKIGVLYNGLGYGTLSVENTSKAYALRARVSQRERLYLESHYYEFATGQLEKAAQSYELWRQLYPQDHNPADNLVLIYALLGNLGKALDSARNAMRLDPNNAESYHDLAFCYLAFKNIKEAETVLGEADARQVGRAYVAWDRFQVAFFKNDHQQMERLVTEYHDLYGLLGFTEAYYGRLAKARALWQIARSEPPTGFALAGTLVDAGLVEAYLGDVQTARRDTRAGLEMNVDDLQAQGMGGLALALAGDTARAEQVASEMRRKWSSYTLVQRYWLPIIKGAIALKRGHPDTAVRSLEAVSSYDLSVIGWLDSVYLRGQAYLMLNDSSSAVTEFQKILDRPGLTFQKPVGVLAHLGLARAYVLQRDSANARAAYQDFLTLWKDADPNIPVLKQAKAEYARLHS